MTDQKTEDAERLERMAARLLAASNELLAEGLTPAEVAAHFVDWGVYLGSSVDPLDLGARCLKASQVLVQRAAEKQQEPPVKSEQFH